MVGHAGVSGLLAVLVGEDEERDVADWVVRPNIILHSTCPGDGDPEVVHDGVRAHILGGDHADVAGVLVVRRHCVS